MKMGKVTEKGRYSMEKISQFDTVWGDLENNKNIELLFECEIKPYKEVNVALVAKDIYNLFVNGVFVSYGPARTAKGYARVEKLDISSFLKEGENTISIYVQSNDTRSEHLAEGEPYMGVCIWGDDKIVKTTADFSCHLVADKLQKVERMSSQRGYVEIYDVKGQLPKIETKQVPCPRVLERKAPYGEYKTCRAEYLFTGRVDVDNTKTWENDFTKLLDEGKKLDAYSRKECDSVISKELLSFEYKKESAPKRLGYSVYGFSRVLSGKFMLKVKVLQKTDLWLTFDDLLKDGYVKFNREHIIHGIKWTLPEGEHTLYSQEVYSGKYIQLISDRNVIIEEVSIIMVENPDVMAFEVPPMEEELHTIVAAAQNSLAQNAFDIYTDCPTRERAGWLCDGYFMGRAEQFFTGENKVEKDFLENFLLYDGTSFEHKGIVPMCYPSSAKTKESFMPAWILWYVLELEDYQKRTGDDAFIALHKQRICDILDYFSGFENEYGLLEDLEGWVFVEWSKASDFVDGVNFPINILYAEVCRIAGELLQEEALIKKYEMLRKVIRELAFDGEVYIDQAIRVDGKLQITKNVSELHQIFAMYFKLEESEAFVKNFIGRFYNVEKKVHPAALFVGSVMRIMTLYELGEYELLLQECKEQFLEMAKMTGTIWELFGGNASCNHGFGAVVGSVICETVLQLRKQKGEGYEKV